jgi:gamma-glutamyltranspeptidase/glutathione hydrolase
LLTTGQHGGDQQGMGNMQVLVNILDLGANMQAAGDMARFTHAQVANKLQLESQLFGLVGPQLISMGHKASSAGGGIAGGYQGIMFVPNPDGGRISACNSEGDGEGESGRDATCGVNGFYRAGSNLREDGDSIGW